MNAPVDAGMLKRHDGPEGLAAEVSPPVAADLADVLDWLAAQFIRAPQREQVHAARSVVGQMLLREMGEVLGNETLMARLGQHLSEGTEEEVTVALQRRYTALFEGVFPRRCALPYASAWQGSGRLYDAPVARMQKLLQTLGMELAPTNHEPADHLAVQLAALAQALRQERWPTVQALLVEMDWMAPFCRAMARLDGEGYYGVMSEVLPVALARVSIGYGTGQEER